MSVFKNIALIVVSPKIGWDEVSRSGFTTRKVEQAGFLPMLALLAVASFVPMFYDSTLWTLSRTLLHALAEFLSFYAAYFLISYLLGGFYPDLVKTNSGRIRLDNFILYNLCFVVILEIFNNLLDNDFAPLYFLLFYSIMLVSKGTIFLGIQGQPKTPKFVALSCLMIMLIPIAFRKILEMMIIH